MSSSIDKLNLKPGEKRLLVGIGIVLFLVLNFMFVFPRFGEVAEIQYETEDLRNTIERYESTISKRKTYQTKLAELEGQGSAVIPGEQALQLQMTVQSQALQSGVTIGRYSPVNRASSSTNAFFDEQSIVVSYNTGYKQLVDFLVRLADHDSMIRVRSMDVKPDPKRYGLQGSITLVASYQKGSKSGAPTTPKTTSTVSAK
jgi:Tfp pilus assembly protein PilO